MDENHSLKALSLAMLISQKTRELRRKPMKNVGLGSMLSILQLGSEAKKGNLEESVMKEHIAAIAPEIYEIILFGSVAAGTENPEDIDLMIIDNGHFSNFVPCNTGKHHADAYEDLSGNLSWLMSGWFEVSEEQLQEILDDVEVDLHVLPLRFLKSEDVRAAITAKHKDPNFFRNAFKTALRFNDFSVEFEPLTLEYLEKRYRCSLGDLR